MSYVNITYIPQVTVIPSVWLNMINAYIWAASGPTANRPVGAPNNWGYLDTSLGPYGVPIKASSLSPTGWVDGAGVPV